MNRYSLLAVTTFACGSMCLVLAAERFAAANCDETVVEPAVCKPARSLPPEENSSGTYCALNENNVCVNEGDCVAQYGSAVAGECEHTGIGGTGGTSVCYDQHHVTIVPIKWYTAACVLTEGNCGCSWTETMYPPPQTVSLCDCQD